MQKDDMMVFLKKYITCLGRRETIARKASRDYFESGHDIEGIHRSSRADTYQEVKEGLEVIYHAFEDHNAEQGRRRHKQKEDKF
jgi:hypothetical protein